MEISVRAGQKWRNVHTGGSGAQVITVDSVEGSTVQGSFTPEDAPGVIGASAWSVGDFESFTLIHDSEWPTHRVVVHCRYGDENVLRAMAPVGWHAGNQSMVPIQGGGTVARAFWDVVAPTADDAMARAKAALHGFSKDYVDLNSIHVDNTAGVRG